MSSDLESLRKRIDEIPLLQGLNILDLAKPSVRLLAVRANDLALGESRIGGLPDVPPGFVWPCWSSVDLQEDQLDRSGNAVVSWPLDFVAQLELSALPVTNGEYPNTGRLYFFVDCGLNPPGFQPGEPGTFRVLYSDAARETLQRAEPPAGHLPAYGSHACRIKPHVEWTLPDYLPDREDYGEVETAYRQLVNDWYGGGLGWTYHRLGGHSQPIQNAMEMECQMVSNGVGYEEWESERAIALKPGAADWRLLLQLDTDEEGPGWMWGDAGTVYFWIKRQDLVLLKFDDVLCLWQCC